MRNAVLLIVVLLPTLSAPASAEVGLMDPNLEVSGRYVHMQSDTFGATEPLVATGVHVMDWNGLYTAVVAAIASSRCESECPKTYAQRASTYESPLGTFTVTVYHGPLEEVKGDTPEDRARRARAQQDIGMGTNSYTELAVYVPRDGTSNVSGGAFGMGGAMFGNTHFALDIGLRWQFMRADVCGTTTDPTRCRHRFFGAPIDFVMKLGHFGLSAGAAWNWRSDKSIYHLDVNVDVVDRLFVRGGVLALTGSFGTPAYVVEVGGRL